MSHQLQRPRHLIPHWNCKKNWIQSYIRNIYMYIYLHCLLSKIYFNWRQLVYNIVVVLPDIDMNQPPGVQVPPSRSLLSPSSPPQSLWVVPIPVDVHQIKLANATVSYMLFEPLWCSKNWPWPPFWFSAPHALMSVTKQWSILTFRLSLRASLTAACQFYYYRSLLFDLTSVTCLKVLQTIQAARLNVQLLFCP